MARGAPKGRGRIFDDIMVAEIRAYYKMGLSYRDLAEMYHCHFTVIRDVIKGYGAYRRDFDV